MQAVVGQHGRIRFRNGALKAAGFANTVRDALLDAKGVLEVQVNRRVGSLLVLFDKGRISGEKILSTVAESLGVDLDKLRAQAASMKKSITSPDGRRNVKRGMMASLAVGLAMLVFSERLHAAAGLAFVALLAAHLYQNKRTLMK